MLVVDGIITMSESEWQQFQEVTRAPWRPRTQDEFNAMCDLGAAMHRAENTEGMCELFAQNCQRIKFDAHGNANFPADKRKLEYIRLHGNSPSPAQLAEFMKSRTSIGSTGLSLVRD